MLLEHASAFEPPQAPASAAAAAPELSLPQLYRDRAMSLLLGATLSGADDGCARLILASAAVGSGNLAAALEHLAHAHQLDMTEACALSNRSIVLQLKGDHAEAFEAVKEAITLRYTRCCLLVHAAHQTTIRLTPACRSPSVPQLYNNLCVLFRNMKKFDDSRKAAAQCLAALPNYAPALNNLALLQITLGQLTDADGNLRASMEADAGLTFTQSNAASLQVRALALCLRALFACFACVLYLRALFARFVCALWFCRGAGACDAYG